MPDQWLADAIRYLAGQFGTDLFLVKALITIVVLCLICGMVGVLVVGNRMAFFSDTMAHCAFAGVALGFLSILFSKGDRADATWLVPLVMVAFGTLIGAGMVYVRDHTGLANDTVIGVFFALALGFGAMFMTLVQQMSRFSLESFLFGNLFFIREIDLLFLGGLLVLVTGIFLWQYNQLMFASFNPSLARTRRMQVTFNNYLFVIVLALVVNLSIQAVGVLLINALLVVPAATAATVSRNLRQMFWLTLAFCLGAGVIGYWISVTQKMNVPTLPNPVGFGPSGVIVVTSVALFFGSMAAIAVWNRFAPIFGGKQFKPMRGSADPCGFDHPFGQCP